MGPPVRRGGTYPSHDGDPSVAAIRPLLQTYSTVINKNDSSVRPGQFPAPRPRVAWVFPCLHLRAVLSLHHHTYPLSYWNCFKTRQWSLLLYHIERNNVFWRHCIPMHSVTHGELSCHSRSNLLEPPGSWQVRGFWSWGLRGRYHIILKGLMTVRLPVTSFAIWANRDSGKILKLHTENMVTMYVIKTLLSKSPPFMREFELLHDEL